MFEPLCANPECQRKVAPDSDHVEITAEWVRMRDRNDQDSYYFHTECWLELAGDWREP